MSQSLPLDLNDPVSLEGLDQMFFQELDLEAASPAVSLRDNTDKEDDAPAFIKAQRNTSNNLPSDLFTRGFEGVEEVKPDAAAPKISPTKPKNTRTIQKPNPVRRTHAGLDALAPLVTPNTETAGTIDLQNPLVDENDKVSRTELVALLQGFVNVLRKDEPEEQLEIARVQQQPEELKFHDVRVEDKTQELEEMRRLVIEAQETIIKLLTDRVEDRARIATLETELRLLPDLQDQADRAMKVAFKTEEFRSELTKVKFELERYRLASVRDRSDRGPRYWLSRVRRWFLKAQGLQLRKYSDQVRSLSSEKGE